MSKTYYSARENGFFDSFNHGSRTIWANDPTWQRPLITITLQPGESYPDRGQLNEAVEPITVEVQDGTAEHPLIEVPNPDCLLPVDAVEITPERHAELLSGNAQGLLIVADENGQPRLQEPPPPSPEQLAARAIAQRTQLLQLAAQAIAPLQDAVDFEEATEAERTALTAWKRYRIMLNRIELQDGYPHSIEWPVRPDEIAA